MSTATEETTIMKCHPQRPKAANYGLLIAQPNVGPLWHKESATICMQRTGRLPGWGRTDPS